jgi:hypothetical protein
MTVLGAVVFGGFLALGVLWLLVTAPDSDIDEAWNQSRWLSPLTQCARHPILWS